jgi:hypothetical protein
MSHWIARRLIVTWKHDSSRPIIPVAELLVSADGRRYEFGYLKGVSEAEGHGFQPFVAFPRFDTRYESSDLFPFFTNRVLPTTRPDYLESLSAVGLDASEANVAEVLGRTNGRRATDRIETILEPVRDSAGRYVTHFLVRGVRYAVDSEKAIASLEAGTRLLAVVDGFNEYNPRARKLVTESGGAIGYVPDYLVADLDSLESAGAAPSVIVERVNPPPTPQHFRVLCRVESVWPRGFVPFDDPRFAPCAAAPHAA